MALPLLALAGIKGLGAYAQYKNATAKNPDMERHLKSKMNQGMYTGTQENQMVGNVARQAYHGAQDTKSNLTGNLIAGGMGNSIAGARAKKDVDTGAQKQVTDMREKIEFEEAMNKTKARDDYEQYKQMEHEKKQQATAQAIGSAVDIGTGMITGTGDFGIGGEHGIGQFKKLKTTLNEGDIKDMTINGQQQRVVWNGTQFVPIS